MTTDSSRTKRLPPKSKLLFLDCDSTLSAIEGIDELARLRGAACFAEIEAMTHAAMEGRIPISEVFGRRLEIIRPTRAECSKVGQMYMECIERGVVEALDAAHAAGWVPCILSAGFREAIEPLAAHLGIEHVEAVGLHFDAAGDYAGYERDYPTTHNGGKPEVIKSWIQQHAPTRTAMVGDGISDLETQPVVDLFVGYGGVVARPRVQAESRAFIRHFDELPALLGESRTLPLARRRRPCGPDGAYTS